MTTPHLAPPPPNVERRAAVPARVTPRALPAPGAPPRASYGQALRWALLLSLLLHAGILLLTGDFTIDPLAGPDPTERPDDFAGLEWVLPVPEGAEGDSPPAASEAEPVVPTEPVVPRVLRVTPGTPDPEPTPPAAAETPRGAPGGRGSARDALRPGYRDPRLYVAPDPLGLRREQQSAHEKYMEHLQARIDAVNDSMGVAAAREAAAKDWTFRDKDGKRWGLSPDGIHLGDITIPNEVVPMPRSTGDNMTREAIEEERRQREEIRRQEEMRARRDTMQARTRAIRERKGGGGPGGGG